MKILRKSWPGLLILLIGLIGLVATIGALWKFVQPPDQVAPVPAANSHQVKPPGNIRDRIPTIPTVEAMPQKPPPAISATNIANQKSRTPANTDSNEHLLRLIEDLEQSNQYLDPGSIESTGIPVTQRTRLQQGQILQVKWGSQGTWWAAKVTSLEDDRSVGIHYVGWADGNDEVVPRDRLQLDPEAHVKALQTQTAESRLRLIELNDPPR